ncbi:MAG: glycosyltransferase family 39 protein [Anaerolineae bacterium]|nr:glycosyltransferase family 39 protein [Anaerolineae bacterium]
MRGRLFDLLWLVLLGVFVFAGMPIATFHGDETNHIYNSNDYATLFIDHRPQDLLIQSHALTRLESQRLLDSGVSRYTIGLAWHLAGLTRDDLPDSSYAWDESYDENLEHGLVPPLDRLIIYRIPSTLFTALSVGIVFLIGRLYGGRGSRPLAYFVSGLYALNPIILLNGRRALQEGSLLFWGLLTIYLAFVIAQKRESGLGVPLRWWLCLIVAGALTQYSKNNGFIYIAAAYLAILVPELVRVHGIAAIALRLAVCAALTVLLFFAISPGLWYDPSARVGI